MRYIKELEQYNKARLKQEYKFSRLPHASALLANLLITLAKPDTGLVSGLTYEDLAVMLTVDAGRGRKNSGKPSKETIIGYLRTIKTHCSDDFKQITVGQNLRFQFPNLPIIYAELCGKKEELRMVHPTVLHTQENQIKTDQKTSFDALVDTDLHTEEDIPTDAAVKKFYINNKTNNNNNSLSEKIGNEKIKKTISQDFYPSQEIIARAIAAGHNNATDNDIIQEFIDKNTAWGSTFADFSPIYLSFLAKHAERKQQEPVTPNSHTRSRNNERASIKVNSYDAALETVARFNQNACKPSTEELFPASKVISAELEYRPCVMAVDGTNQNIRHFVSY